MIKNNTFAGVSSILLKAAGYDFDTYCSMDDESGNEMVTINSVNGGYEITREFTEENIFGGAPVKMWEKTLLDDDLKVIAESDCMRPNLEYDKAKKDMEVKIYRIKYTYGFRYGEDGDRVIRAKSKEEAMKKFSEELYPDDYRAGISYEIVSVHDLSGNLVK